MKLYQKFERIAFCNEEKKPEQKIDIKVPALVTLSDSSIEDNSKIKVQTSILETNNHKSKFTYGLVLWRMALELFYGIKNIKIDSIEIRLLKRIWSMISDVNDFWYNVLILLYIYKFEKWYREKNLIPRISALSKNWNNLLGMHKKFEPYIRFFHQYKLIIKGLGLQPFVLFKNDKIPFGLDLPDEYKQQGLTLMDVKEIDGRRLLLMNFDGELHDVIGYCHFGMKKDLITQQSLISYDDILWLNLSDIDDFKLSYWFKKDVFKTREEFLCFQKKLTE